MQKLLNIPPNGVIASRSEEIQSFLRQFIGIRLDCSAASDSQ
jgi:hypothetical protein